MTRRRHKSISTHRPESPRLSLESLEDRHLLTGVTLEIVGTKGNNVIDLTMNQATGMIEVRVDGLNPFLAVPNGFDPDDLERIRIRALRGHDTISVDAAIQVPTEIYGESGHDTIVGGGGSDFIDGGTGNDSIAGGAGDDTISDATGNDTMSGGEGDDSLLGGRGNDLLDGAAGDDQLFGGVGNDVVHGDEGNDDLSGDAGNDQIFGSDGDDVLRPGRGRDSLSGGAGVDMFGTVTRGGLRVDFDPQEDLEITQVLMPDFSLPDLNPNATSFNQNIGPTVFRGSVSAYYFTHAG